MFYKWEEELRTSSNASSDMEGVLDLSLPKNPDHSGSESTTSPDRPSSSSASSSASVLEVENRGPEDDNSFDSTEKESCNGVMHSPHEDHVEVKIEVDNDDMDNSSSNTKMSRISAPSPEPEIDNLYPAFQFPRANESESYGEPDHQPIRCANRGVVLSLHDEVLWNAFRKVGTEMIINRGGRRMFPHVILSVMGLNPSATYSISMDIALADDRRFKYVNNQWLGMGMADPGPDTKTVSHPDSPNSGNYWMQSRISFSKVRLTNNKDSSDENILLLSMHKYKVVIKIKNESVPYDDTLSFVFDESTFVAVTAYQNNKITKLKIQNNPFAKAFRDAPHKQKGERKRKSCGSPNDTDTDFSVFKVSGNKKTQLTSTPKDKPVSSLPYPGWDPWFMSGLGQRIPVPGTPLYDMAAQQHRMDRFVDPRMYMNPALMAHLSYLPFLSMTQQLGQRLPYTLTPAVNKDDPDLSDQHSARSDHADDNKVPTDIDSASKSSDDYT